MLSTGSVVALYNYMSQILLELIKFANLIVTLNRSFASASRVNEIFDVKPSMINKDGTFDENCDTAVELKNAGLEYHELSDEALSNISFSIKKVISLTCSFCRFCA